MARAKNAISVASYPKCHLRNSSVSSRRSGASQYCLFGMLIRVGNQPEMRRFRPNISNGRPIPNTTIKIAYPVCVIQPLGFPGAVKMRGHGLGQRWHGEREIDQEDNSE